jgi:hypothetical protein
VDVVNRQQRVGVYQLVLVRRRRHKWRCPDSALTPGGKVTRLKGGEEEEEKKMGRCGLGGTRGRRRRKARKASGK